MKNLRAVITAQHEEFQETPIRSVFNGFLTKLPMMGFGDPVCTIEMDADTMGEEAPPPALDPTDYTVDQLHVEMSRNLSEFDLRHAIVTEVLGKHRRTALEVLAHALHAFG